MDAPLAHLRLAGAPLQILLSTPHWGFSEIILITEIVKKGNKMLKKMLIDKQLLKNYLHIKFMTLKIDLKGRLSFYVFTCSLLVPINCG